MAATPERSFTYEHCGFAVQATVWNEPDAAPHVLFDWNNVLNRHTHRELYRAAAVKRVDPDAPRAVVSLLATHGEHYESLKRMACSTGETVVALVARFKGDRTACETGVKRRALELLGWLDSARHALDDKPHEWQEGGERFPLKLTSDDKNPNQKTVYLVSFHDALERSGGAEPTAPRFRHKNRLQ